MSRGPGESGADWADRPPIAIVGMGVVLPGTDSVAALREQIHTRQAHFMTVPTERWDARRYRADYPGMPDRVTCDRGAFLGPIAFRPEDFRLPPNGSRELHRMDKALMVAAREALTDAGLAPAVMRRQRGAVIIGFMSYGTSSQRNVVFKARLPEALAAVRATERFAALPAALREALLVRVEAIYRAELRDANGSEDTVVNVYSSAAAAHIARMADVRGPHRVVDAACASSFAALADAIQGLHDGRYDVVVTGGASPQITPLLLVGLAPLGVLGGEIVTPFGGAGGGTLLGEGATILVLQRLEDALRVGRRVRAVIRGIGCAGNGGSRALFTSSVDGQTTALRMAYARAGYGPQAVQYVEAHANGVPEGDRAELEALTRVFAPSVASGQSVAIGSMKDRIGYLLSGAGAAGVARTIVAMEEGVVPFQVADAAPGTDLPFAGGPFHLSTQPQPWEPAEVGLPRRAGVSAFGFGGANFHVTLEGFDPTYHRGAFAPLRRRTLREEPVALVGMGVLLPGAPDVATLWSNLLTGRDLGREQSGDWFATQPRDWEGVSGAFTARAARVEGFGCDWRRLRLPPRVVEHLDPSHLWILTAAAQAVAQAGFASGLPAARTAVILAATPGTPLAAGLELRVVYAEFDAALGQALREHDFPDVVSRALRDEAEQRFKALLPSFTEDSVLGTLRNVAAGRLAQFLGTTGPCHAVDAACASSAAALESAVRGLLADEFDVAVVGGLWSGPTAEYFFNTAIFGGNSGSVCRPFDPRADGTIPGEGAAVVILQRMSDTRGDAPVGARTVQAVIRGFGTSGSATGGSLYSVSVPGLVQATREALSEAGVGPESVGLIEAHGSCMPMGDAAELSALGAVYGARERSAPIALACMKSNMGNLMAASGLTSLVGTVLALQHGFVPPLVHSHWDERAASAAPAFRPSSKARSWHAMPGEPRRAGLSMYGMGGINYHLVVDAPSAGPTGSA